MTGNQQTPQQAAENYGEKEFPNWHKQGPDIYDEHAACTIAQQAFIAGAAYERERAWVKVSERLPEEEGYYLVYYTIQAMDMVYKYEEVFYYSKGEWSQGGEDVAEPLFWMPLPNPPQHNTTEIK